ncbi:uncharacterized protein LOC123868713 [Maniola jurtina]|uniref:uncharacterized protein LOC123868713 n=1 Tax=Maniola jurtina TaxID=191418 RepID=UPI001E68E6C8|nr:uncharacterized protein LOC123868713 [Maniola jurtina]
MIDSINKLLDLGAISVCNRSKNDFCSRIFLAPKPNGSKRFILNLKALNKFIHTTHFKMEDHRTAARLVPRSGFMANIDLTEAYLLVPIIKAHRKYLRFEFDGSCYEFNAMPYGLSVAPRVFTKLMKEVMSFLRKMGYKSVIYLDDILCIGNTYVECQDNVNKTVYWLQCLGFVINYNKSNLIPRQVCRFLGFIYNTVDMTLSLPDEKRQSIMRLVEKFITLPKCSIRELSQFIGVLTAACPAVKYGWLYTKILERQKYLALKQFENFEVKIRLTDVILPDLYWWRENITSTSNLLRSDNNFELEIFTDASKIGWGAFCNGKRVNGGWKVDESSFHINRLELLAAFLGLKCFASTRYNCSILLRVDNTTALCYINRMGGIRFPHLNDLAKQIWQWCEMRQISLFASYINTHANIEADQESRKTNWDIEWELSQWAFQRIVKSLGEPQIDLFASRTNAKCSLYVSWKPDPDATYIDAFTISWQSVFFYAFPPFALILKCLRKIITDKATGILVFPYWPGQAWFPLLKKMLISDIVIFEPTWDILRSNYRSCHRLHRSLSLGAATLSGKHSVD